jgi:two-component system phosphate regulon sensor histidine kinase PhoR
MSGFLRRFGLFLIAFGLLGAVILMATESVRATVATVDWSLLAALLTGLALLAAGFLTWQNRQRQAQMALLIGKIQALQQPNGAFGHVLLRPEDPFFGLADAINQAQSYQRRQFETLQQREASLAALMANMPVGAMEIGADREVLSLNDRAANLLGIPGPTEGQHYDDLIRQHNLLTMLEQGLTRQESMRQQLSLTTATGERSIDVRLAHYQTVGERSVMLVLFYDITDLVQLQTMQADFVVNASHELRTPLTAIAGFTETLLQGAQDDPDARERFLGIINQETQRLLALTADILALSKVSKTISGDQEVNLRAWTETYLVAQERSLQEHDIQIENALAPTLTVQLPEQTVALLLSNLIANAIKYNRQGGTIRLSNREDEANIMIAIQDTGLGIPSDEQARVFERFYRVDKSRNQKIAGTGLGLAIVAEQMQQLGGSVDLVSQVGVGTTVTLVLPKTSKL